MDMCTALRERQDRASETTLHASSFTEAQQMRGPSPGSGLINDRPLPPSLAFVSHEEWHAVKNALNLSNREFQIVQMVCAEFKDCAIAEYLGISVHTVRTHFERLFRKLEVNSRVGLVMSAFRTFRANQMQRGHHMLSLIPVPADVPQSSAG